MSDTHPVHHQYDVVIVGAGCAGLRAALESSARARTAVLSKVHPLRSHTVVARDGIAAALGSVENDLPQWHAFDTSGSGAGLADHDAVQAMCTDAPSLVRELERMGMPFSRTPDGRIGQRLLTGHTGDCGVAPVHRGCYAADRTGQHVLHTLYQNCIRRGVRFFDEFSVLDLLLSDGSAAGVVGYEAATGDLHVFAAASVVLATGGAARLFATTSGASGLTGDGMTLALRQGLPLQDMEFVQFCPTALADSGIALSETARRAGGVLRNSAGDQFVQQGPPGQPDLVGDDVLCRAIATELRAGRGTGPDGRSVLLDLTAIEPEEVTTRLPEIAEYVVTYLGADALLEPITVRPAALAALGGVPTTVHGEVLRAAGETVPGLYAAGDLACTGVHGAHRLPGNGLTEALVFGRRAGIDAAEHAGGGAHPTLPVEPAGATRARISRLLSASGTERLAPIRQSLRGTLETDAGVCRSDDSLAHAQAQLAQLHDRYADIALGDKGSRFNAELLAALELGTQLELADTLVAAARARTESRGVHFREDYPERDDAALAHRTLAYRRTDGTVDLVPAPAGEQRPKGTP